MHSFIFEISPVSEALLIFTLCSSEITVNNLSKYSIIIFLDSSTEQSFVSKNPAAANVELNVLEYKLFGETYSSVRESSDGKIYTPQELYDTLTSYYPFILTISTNANSVRAGEKITITVDCEWPYDGARTNPDDDTSTPDGWDTYWGNKAYEYYETVGSTEKSLEIQIEIKTTQVK